MDNAKFQLSRRELNNRYLKLLKEGIDDNKIELELIPAAKNDLALLQKIAEKLKEVSLAQAAAEEVQRV